MTVYGVDVHDGYQAGISFPLLYQQGYRFAAVKLTEGSTYVRDLADEWIQAARSAGLLAGAYHWLTASDGAAQARWFYQNLQRVGGPSGLLIQLDCEDDGYGPQIRDWAAEWNRLTGGGHPVFIYSGHWWWSQTAMAGVNGAVVTPYLWDSHYLTADTDTLPDDPAAFASRIPSTWWSPGYGGWTTSTILQFTSKGDAGGLANKVDLNVYRGTLDQLRAMTGGPMTITYEQYDRDRLSATYDAVTKLATDSKTRDTALAADVAAVKSAVAALVATGTSADTAAILAKMQELADADRARAESHAAEVAALRNRLAAAEQAAAAVLAAG